MALTMTMFCFPCIASPSSHLPPAVAACCCVFDCQFFSGWRSDAQAGQEEGTRSDPEDQPRYKHGWWHSHLESARLNVPRDKAFYCPSAPEEKEDRRGGEIISQIFYFPEHKLVQVLRAKTTQKSTLQSIQFILSGHIVHSHMNTCMGTNRVKL